MSKPLKELLEAWQIEGREMAHRLRMLDAVVERCLAENAPPKTSWLRRILDGVKP